MKNKTDPNNSHHEETLHHIKGILETHISAQKQHLKKVNKVLRKYKKDQTKANNNQPRSTSDINKHIDIFTSLVKDAPFGIIFIDSKFLLQQINKGAEEAFSNIHPLLGRDFGEILRIIWQEPFATETINHFRHTLKTGESYISSPIVQKRNDIDEVQSYDWQIHRITLPDGSYGVICYFYNLTEQKRLERSVRRAAEMAAYRVTLTDALRPVADPLVIQEVATKVLGKYLKTSRALYYIVQTEKDSDYYVVDKEYCAPGISSVVGKHRANNFGRSLLNKLRSGQTLVIKNALKEPLLKAKEKKVYRAYQTSALVSVPLIKEGKHVASISVHQSEPREWKKDEIELIEETAERTWAAVERARAEEAIKESNRRFRFMADAMPQKVYTATPDGSVDYCNHQWLDYAGLSMDELLGRDWRKIIHPDDLKESMKRWRHSLKTGEPYQFENRYKQKNGEYRWHLSRALPLYDGHTITMWVGTNTDIHEQKTTAEELQHKNVTLMNAVIEGTNDAIYVKDRKGKYIMVNTAGSKLIGKRIKDILGKKDNELISSKQAHAVSTTDQRIMKSGQTETFEETITTSETTRTFLSTKTPFKDNKGNTIGIIGVSRDISGRKELEQRKDDFISMASHELKTPVTSIKALGQILQRDMNLKPVLRKQYVEKINTQIDRIIELITDLLDISKIEKGKLELVQQPFKFDDFVKETIDTVRQTIKTHKIYLRGKTHQTIVADPYRIAQVIINLLTNAVKYSPNAREVVVTLEAKKNFVSLSVRDYGIGIPSKDQSQIFKRFYRVVEITDKTFPGLGVGLYISHQIVRRHGGDIFVKSALGKGALFKFTLPINTKSKQNKFDTLVAGSILTEDHENSKQS